VSLSLTFGRNDKIEHHLMMKILKLIILKSWIRDSVNPSCNLSSGFIVSLVNFCLEQPIKNNKFMYLYTYI